MDSCVDLNQKVYEEKGTGRWVAEISDFPPPAEPGQPVVGKVIWQDIFDSRKEADKAAQRELDRRTELSNGPSLKAAQPPRDQ